MIRVPHRLRRSWRNLEARAVRLRLRDPAGDLPVVIVAGAPRSGTTWVAEVVARATRSRLLFEPLAPAAPGTDGMEVFPYLEEGDEAPKLERHLERAFGGRLGGEWIDVRPIVHRPRGRVVKLVRACLMLDWIAERFATIPIVYVTRDPWSVVRSRILMSWDPLPDCEALLRQPALLRRLGGPADLVRAIVTELRECSRAAGGGEVGGGLAVEANALLWAVHNRVAHEDLAGRGAVMLEFDALVDRPREEFSRALAGLTARTALRASDGRLSRAIGRPSTTSRAGTRSRGYGQFRDEFGTAAAARVAEIAASFGLPRE